MPLNKLDSEKIRKAHATLAVVWAFLAIPSILWWKNSTEYLVYVSVYTVIIEHILGWAKKDKG